MPVPRRFDRRPPERDTTRVNERIRVPEVRVIGDDGQQIGVMKTDQALRMAQERDLDLVEVAPEVPRAKHAELCRDIVMLLQRELNFTSAVELVPSGTLASEKKTRRVVRSYRGETLDG